MRIPRLDPLRLCCAASLVAFFIPIYAAGGVGDDDGQAGGSALPATADVARGALLYDRWWSELGASPPSTTGPTTGRCAECHGWDYEGASGASSAGEHDMGAIGLLRSAGRAPQALFDAIQGSGPAHGFAARLGAADVWDLVAFLQTGASDTSPWIDAKGVARGDARSGGPLYTAQCGTCHGCDGGGVELAGVPGVGELARSRPWRVLHAIRWGVAGSGMQSMEAEGLGATAQSDLLAYVQTLTRGAATAPPPPPPAGATLSYARDVHPIWAARGCVGCHRGSAGMVLSGNPSESHAQLFGSAVRVDLATPSNSLVLKKPSMGGVPHGGGRIFPCTSDPDFQRILTWIRQGGLDN